MHKRSIWLSYISLTAPYFLAADPWCAQCLIIQFGYPFKYDSHLVHNCKQKSQCAYRTDRRRTLERRDAATHAETKEACSSNICQYKYAMVRPPWRQGPVHPFFRSKEGNVNVCKLSDCVGNASACRVMFVGSLRYANIESRIYIHRKDVNDCTHRLQDRSLNRIEAYIDDFYSWFLWLANEVGVGCSQLLRIGAWKVIHGAPIVYVDLL